jgi:hypothetical protein
VRLEAEAVLLILGRCQSREWQMLGSEAIDAEIAQTPDVERRKRLMLLASLAMNKVIVNKQILPSPSDARTNPASVTGA